MTTTQTPKSDDIYMQWLKTAVGALSKAARSSATLRMTDRNVIRCTSLTDTTAVNHYNTLLQKELHVTFRFTDYELNDKNTNELLKIGNKARTKENDDAYRVLYITFGQLNVRAMDMTIAAPVFLLPIKIIRDKDDKKRVRIGRNGDIILNRSLLRELQPRALDHGKEMQQKIIDLLRTSYGDGTPIQPKTISEIHTFIKNELAPITNTLFEHANAELEENPVNIGMFQTEKDAFIQDIQRIIDAGANRDRSSLDSFLLPKPDQSTSRDGITQTSSADVRTLYPFEKYLTYSCDASQRKVLDRILDKGESVVVQGPPGTGKSQTIVNLLRCAAAIGKKVVFVAEKDAAFDSIIEKINPNWLGSEAKKRSENTLFDPFVLDARYINFKQKKKKSEYRNESKNAGDTPTRNETGPAQRSFVRMSRLFHRIITMYDMLTNVTAHPKSAQGVTDGEELLSIVDVLNKWGPDTRPTFAQQWIQTYEIWDKIKNFYINDVKWYRIWERETWRSYYIRLCILGIFSPLFARIVRDKILVNEDIGSAFHSNTEDRDYTELPRRFQLLADIISRYSQSVNQPNQATAVFMLATHEVLLRYLLTQPRYAFRPPANPNREQAKRTMLATIAYQFESLIYQVFNPTSITKFLRKLQEFSTEFGKTYAQDLNSYGKIRFTEAALTHVNSTQINDFSSAWDDMIQAFPIWLATPDSLPNLLSTKQVFDLVVFDEASQIIPTHVVGALYRAKQCVIMGDENQLPPTTFFERKDSDDDMIPELREFLASTGTNLIAWAKQSNLPTYELKNFYRGSEELIRMSNQRFYTTGINSGLLTLPDTKPTGHIEHLIIKPHEDVEQGTSAVIEKVKEITKTILNEPSSEGVIIICTGQNDEDKAGIILADLLYERDSEEDDSASNERLRKQVRLRSIEDVQGLEDSHVILFLRQPQRTSDGYVNLQFLGPINGENGHKRLNVALTRARKKVVLVTTFEADELAAGGVELNDGCSFLFNYMKDIDVIDRNTTRMSDNSMNWERAIYDVVFKGDALTGWRTHYEYGRSRYPVTYAFRRTAMGKEDGNFVYAMETDLGRFTRKDFDPRDLYNRDKRMAERLGWKHANLFPVLDMFNKTKAKLRSSYSKKLKY
jgi:hypothetical protein